MCRICRIVYWWRSVPLPCGQYMAIFNKRPCPREWTKSWRVKRVQGSKCRNLQPIDFEKVTSPCFLHQASSSQELRVRISNADPKVFANLNRHILENKDCWSAWIWIKVTNNCLPQRKKSSFWKVPIVNADFAKHKFRFFFHWYCYKTIIITIFETAVLRTFVANLIMSRFMRSIWRVFTWDSFHFFWLCLMGRARDQRRPGGQRVRPPSIGKKEQFFRETFPSAWRH